MTSCYGIASTACGEVETIIVHNLSTRQSRLKMVTWAIHVSNISHINMHTKQQVMIITYTPDIGLLHEQDFECQVAHQEEKQWGRKSY